MMGSVPRTPSPPPIGVHPDYRKCSLYEGRQTFSITRTIDGIEQQLHVGETEIGMQTGSGPHASGGACTFEQFLAGQYQSLVRSTFGVSVLASVFRALGSADADDWLEDGKPPERWANDDGQQSLVVDPRGVYLEPAAAAEVGARPASWSHREFSRQQPDGVLTSFGDTLASAKRRAHDVAWANHYRNEKDRVLTGTDEQWRDAFAKRDSRRKVLAALEEADVDAAEWLWRRVSDPKHGEAWERAIGQWEDPDASLLIRLLDAGPGFARAAAARALAGGGGGKTVQILVQRLGRDLRFDGPLLDAIAIIGPPARFQATAPIAECMERPSLRIPAIAALHSIGAGGPLVLEALALALGDDDLEVVQYACLLVSDLGADATGLASELAKLVVADPRRREAALDALEATDQLVPLTPQWVAYCGSTEAKHHGPGREALSRAAGQDPDAVAKMLQEQHAAATREQRWSIVELSKRLPVKPVFDLSNAEGPAEQPVKGTPTAATVSESPPRPPHENPLSPKLTVSDATAASRPTHVYELLGASADGPVHGWSAGRPPGLTDATWPRNRRNGLPMRHTCTLLLPEDYRCHGPELVGLSLFEADDHLANRLDGVAQTIDDEAPPPGDTPFWRGLAAYRAQRCPSEKYIEDGRLGGGYTVIWWTREQLLRPPAALPSAELKPDAPPGDCTDAWRGDKPFRPVVWHIRTDDPNAGKSPRDADYLSARDSKGRELYDRYHGSMHLGGTSVPCQQPADWELPGPFYLELEHGFGGLNFGGGNGQLDLESHEINWAQ